MVRQIFSIISTSLLYAASWFEDILSATGLTGVFLAGVFLVLLSKFILTPIFGSAGSDRVTKRNKDGANNV